MEAAINEMVVHNLRLVVSIAKHSYYQNRGVELIDRISVGNIALRKAARLFDARRGFKFSTYATWLIRNAISRVFDSEAHTIRQPTHVRKKRGEIAVAQIQLMQQKARDADAGGGGRTCRDSSRGTHTC